MDKSAVRKTFQKYTMVIALVLVIIFFFWGTNGAILIPQNINNLLSQNAYVFILGTGMLLCILTGGNIDLSVGSVLCFCGGIGALMMSKGMNPWIAALAMVIVGTVIGLWQAFWVAYVKVPPFIVTLAGMFAFRGLANVVLDGYTVTVDNKLFLNVFGGGKDCYVPSPFPAIFGLNTLCVIVGVLGVAAYIIISIINRAKASKKGIDTGSFVGFILRLVVISAVLLFITYKLASYNGIPTSLIWIMLVIAVFAYVTNKTTMGRHLYAVGGNEKATALSGINTKRVYFFAYTIMGLLSGFAAILTTARMQSAAPTAGMVYEMDAIGACFIGGASAYGGTGSVFGAIIGAVLMGVINQGMSIMGVDTNYQKVVKGLVLLVAVIFDVLSKREKK